MDNKEKENNCDRVYTLKWDVGAHIGFSKKIEATILSAIRHSMYTTQFFMGNPKSYNRQRISDEDIASSKRLLSRFPMNVFSHFPYIANLNGSLDSLAWNGDSVIDGKLSHLLKELEYELSVVANFSGKKMRSGVVIHPGCFRDRGVGLDTISKTINRINFVENAKLLLENCAGEGNKLCRNFVEIKRIIDGVDKDKKKHIGVCVDTAHIWGVGDYDLRKCEEVDRMFEEFEEVLGLYNFTLLHLNDSMVPKGSRKDRHCVLGGGYIWRESFESLIYLLNKCKSYGIPMVLETHGMDMVTLSLLGETEEVSL